MSFFFCEGTLSLGIEAEIAAGESFALVIGSEGGFSGSERALLVEKNTAQARLGNYTLRAETAAIAGLAILASAPVYKTV